MDDNIIKQLRPDIYIPLGELRCEAYKKKNILILEPALNLIDKLNEMKNLSSDDIIKNQCEILRIIQNSINESFYLAEFFLNFNTVISQGIINLIILISKNKTNNLNLEQFSSHIQFTHRMYKLFFDIVKIKNGDVICDICNDFSFEKQYNDDIKNFDKYDLFTKNLVKHILFVMKSDINNNIQCLDDNDKFKKIIEDFRDKIYNLDYKNSEEFFRFYNKERPEFFALCEQVYYNPEKDKYRNLRSAFQAIQYSESFEHVSVDKMKNEIETSYKNILNGFNDLSNKSEWLKLLKQCMAIETSNIFDLSYDNFTIPIDNSVNKLDITMGLPLMYNYMAFQSTIKWMLAEQIINASNNIPLCFDKALYINFYS